MPQLRLAFLLNAVMTASRSPCVLQTSAENELIYANQPPSPNYPALRSVKRIRKRACQAAMVHETNLKIAQITSVQWTDAHSTPAHDQGATWAQHTPETRLTGRGYTAMARRVPRICLSFLSLFSSGLIPSTFSFDDG